MVLAGQVAYCRGLDARLHAQTAETELAKLKVEAVVAQYEAVQGTLIKERQAASRLTPKLAAFVGAIKKADPKARVDAVSTMTIAIKDEASPSTIAETYVEDAHHRFRFDLPSGLLHRSQKFKLDAVTVRDTDGTYRLMKTDFREYDPKTGEEIPSVGVEIEPSLYFSDAKVDGPGPWHLRGIAAIAYPFGVGGGIEVNPWKKLCLDVLLLYQPNEKAVVGAVGVEYRLFDSTIAVGPYVGVTSHGGSIVGGVVATIEVTR